MRKLTRFLLAAVFTLLLLSTAFADGEIRPLPIDLSGGAPYTETYKADLLVYEDPSIRAERILKTEDREIGVIYYTVDIRIQDPSQIRTAPADPTGFLSERRIPADAIARRMNAVFAINGDYCANFNKEESTKYIFRQGTLYRDTVDTGLDMLIIDEDGNFHIIPGGPELETMDKTRVNGRKTVNVLQFGPGLVVDGEPVPDEYILDRAHSPRFAEPERLATRLCLVQIEPLHYMAVCTRDLATLAELKQLVLKVAPGCSNAYVLDGGGSAQMIFLGQKINNVTAETSKNVRNISDIVYFASAWFPEEGQNP